MLCWFRCSCLVTILLLLGNISVFSDAKKDLECIDDLEDESVFRGTELLMAWILSDRHGTQYVHVRDADGTYSEKLVRKHRNYVELFLEDSKTIKAFFKLHGGLFRETFKLVGKGSGKVLESTDKREISRNIASVKIAGIVVDSFGNIYSYKMIKGSCIYDKVAKAASVFPSNVYSIINCNVFYEEHKQVKIGSLEGDELCFYKPKHWSFVQIYDKEWEKMVGGCKPIGFQVILKRHRTPKSTTAHLKPTSSTSERSYSAADEDILSTETSSESYLSQHSSDTSAAPTPMKKSSPILFASLLGVGIFLASVSAAFIALLLMGKVCTGNSDASDADDENAISENSVD